MSADDTPDDEHREEPTAGTDDDAFDPDEPGDAREELTDRLGEGADRAVEGFDQGLIDLLSWVLDTDTRARIYVFLRKHPDSTSEEIAEGTGLYPSTVREALAELTDEEVVSRGKRQSEGAGNNPYEYAAIPPSELVGGIAGQVQHQLNTIFNLDDHLDGDRETGGDSEPVTITVRSADDDGGSDPLAGDDDDQDVGSVDDADEHDETTDDA